MTLSGLDKLNKLGEHNVGKCDTVIKIWRHNSVI